MRTWSLNAKILGILAIFLVASIIISVLGVHQSALLHDSVDYLVGKVSRRVIHAQDMRSSLRAMMAAEARMIEASDRGAASRFAEEYAKHGAAFADSLAKMMGIIDERKAATWRAVGEEFKVLTDVGAEVRKKALGDRDGGAVAESAEKNRVNQEAIEKHIEELIEESRREMEAEEAEANKVYASAKVTLVGTSVLAMLLGILMALYVLRTLNASIDHVIKSLGEEAGHVAGAARQISAASEALAGAATEQASSLEQTAASVEEMSSMIQKNTENARETSAVAARSHDSAVRGKDVVRRMIGAIEDINDSNEKIAEVVKVIQDIETKTKVINEIVFQTKLLSFNASVEAARAGEHGKGFAVVAAEVGNLAQMSGSAAKEISAMLETSTESVRRLVSKGREKVEVGTGVARECGGVLDEIVANVESVSRMAEEIARASGEQSHGIREINKATSQLEEVTRDNAKSSEEAASAAEALTGQAAALRGAVGELEAIIKGRGRTGEERGPAKSAVEGRMRGGVRAPAPAHRGALGRTVGETPQDPDPAAGAANIPAENDERFEDV